HVVQRDSQGQEQRLVLAAPDLDPVGVAHAEPLLRDGRDDVAVALDLVLVVDEVAVRLEILAALDVDVEAVADSHQRLVDRRHHLAVALDLHRVADAELLLLDLGDLVAVAVLEDEGVADAERLAVDLVDALPLVVLDPGVVADGGELLSMLEPPALRRVVAVPKESHGQPLVAGAVAAEPTLR